MRRHLIVIGAGFLLSLLLIVGSGTPIGEGLAWLGMAVTVVLGPVVFAYGFAGLAYGIGRAAVALTPQARRARRLRRQRDRLRRLRRLEREAHRQLEAVAPEYARRLNPRLESNQRR